MLLHTKSHLAWRIMRFAYGAVVLLAGLDKVLGTNLIVFWPKYVSSVAGGALAAVGLSIPAFLIIIGLIEIVVGVMAFTRFTMLSSYISVAWLLLISVNLLLIGGYVDVAIRDILLAIGAFATATLAHGLGYTITGARSEMPAHAAPHAQTA